MTAVSRTNEQVGRAAYLDNQPDSETELKDQ